MTEWTAQVNDLVGGWIVTTYPHPLSAHDTRPDGDLAKRGAIIADCCTLADAALIAELLNGHRAAESSRRDWAAEAMRLELAFDEVVKSLSEEIAWQKHAYRDGADKVATGRTIGMGDALKTIRDTFSRPVCAVHPDEEAAR